MSSYGQLFILLWLYRYVRLIVNCISHWTFKPIPLPNEPTLTSQDVTIIIPTIDGDGEELRQTIRSCLQTEPFEIILVTIDANLKRAMQMVMTMPTSRIRVLSVAHANKRRQMCHAIPEVTTKITLFADDDVTWPRQILEWILAPFELPEYGGVGTCQRLRRAESPDWSTRIWNFLGAIYLERRNFDISATTHLDGGIPCLSGRTVAYRTHILQDPAFTYGFTHEYWLQKFQLNADDDNFITRWMLSHGWKTMVQYCKDAELRTTLEDNPRFLKQCLRWSRSNWRSNLKSMFYEGYVWTKQPWSTYAIHLPTLTACAIVWDPMLIYLCYRATEGWSNRTQFLAIGTLLAWMFLSKSIKLIGHFVRYPEDIVLLPVSMLFGYFHSFIKLYAFLTLNVTTWGSREGADTDDAYRMIRLNQAELEKQLIYNS
ncbi:glycosyltransferase family 2 protein [Xylona heveae TC161]|uniref:Glycosyltransferase family 2 protein n=1 Tax=Xylona heveae (strain CBS 132557 / TC161) TaxID=1328760 RepID=A0A165GBN1_XYLHT|nr:glycosyltransferase family 2 protein [Xylona heveae TC161]KZF21994.1 glycosyltransferase family 2 protein [Xylona heveae TC161]